MSLIQTLEESGHESLTAVEHAAAWLVGKLATGYSALHELEASSPLVAAAITAGEASATAHGIPIVAIADVGAAVLAAARAFTGGLTEAPPKPGTT